ncbi:MAG: glutathione S-transferase N-terminal domain-containing protein [Nevskia sp.]|nr:glutathione S-transferase N-terminal domain-containing protein [Nevskia sp.]
MLKLVIGNRRFSSWSMRPWLLMKQLGIPFETQQVPYTRADWAGTVRALHAAGTVPVLIAGELVVGDTLAIVETLAELFPDRGIWPADRVLRARARSLCAEMHSSFGAVREECSFDAFSPGEPRALSARATAQMARADAIFASADAGGGFLCGAYSAADAFYTPLALRVLQYGLTVSAQARVYIDRVAGLPAVRAWLAEAEAERDWPPVMPGGRPYHRAVISAEDALRLARRWVAAWNARDLDAVLAMFAAEGAAFVSPKAESILGHARVEGQDGLRRYWSAALERIPRIEFRLEAADWDPATSTVLVVYDADLDGRRSRAAERWVLDHAGRIRYGEAYYGASA